MQTTEKVWEKVLSPHAIDFSGNSVFGNQNCLDSAITILELGLAEKINFGTVLIWDTNQKMWTNFYAWHCWNITKTGQPLDLSLHHWQDTFDQLSPVIIAEKLPLEMSCIAVTGSGGFNPFERNFTVANIIYMNGSLTSVHLDLISRKIKTLVTMSGFSNGFTLEQIMNLLK